VFHQVLEHRWFLSESKGSDVGTDAAATDYFRTILEQLPVEHHAAADGIVTGAIPITRAD
jgi:Domain of unknown function (DUF4032)